ncbi:MAG: hypothetical protein F7C35_05165, partial [Desulfurococcales archaeon]|nr:hypothetical protein [Desulfurococcales archaeon]
ELNIIIEQLKKSYTYELCKKTIKILKQLFNNLYNEKDENSIINVLEKIRIREPLIIVILLKTIQETVRDAPEVDKNKQNPRTYKTNNL